MSEREGLLLIGGERDFNIHGLAKAAARREIPCTVVPLSDARRYAWDLRVANPAVDGRMLAGDSIFIRLDTFALKTRNEDRCHDEYSFWLGWALTTRLKMFNRGFLTRHSGNKVYNLRLAQALGFDIPLTLISSHPDGIADYFETDRVVYKPVRGGDLCRLYVSPQETRTLPAFFQEKLVSPEVRVYQIGTKQFAFQINDANLDYRELDNAHITEVPVPSYLTQPTRKLCKALGLEFAALDLKSDPGTGRLKFLEINSNPMFMAFDYISKGKVTDAMLDWLTTKQTSKQTRSHPPSRA